MSEGSPNHPDTVATVDPVYVTQTNWKRIDRWINSIGLNNTLLTFVLAQAVGSALFGYSTAVLNTSNHHVSNWHLDASEDHAIFQMFNSVLVFVGAAVGAMTSGFFINKMGLVKTFRVGLVIMFIANLVTLASVDRWMFWIGRLVLGYPIGWFSAITPTLIGGISPADKRGMMGVVHQIVLVATQCFAIALGCAFQEAVDEEETGIEDVNGFNHFWWRFMQGFNILIVLVGALLSCYMYPITTVQEYVKAHRDGDAIELIKRTNKDAATNEQLLNDIMDESRVLEGRTDVTNEKFLEAIGSGSEPISFSEAFKKPGYGKAFTVGIILALLQQFTGINAFVTNSFKMFSAMGMSVTVSNVVSIGINLISCLFSFIPLFKLDSRGRVWFLRVGAVGMFVAVIPAMISLWIDFVKREEDSGYETTTTQILCIAGTCVFMAFFAIAAGPITWIYLFEIFPRDVAPVFSGLCTAANWIGSVIMVAASSYMSPLISFTLFFVFCAVNVLFNFTMVKETKGLAVGNSPYVA